MPTTEELKRAVCEAIDQRREAIITLGETILRQPETGFREVRTAQRVAEQMEALGLRPQTGLALTGVKGRLPGGAGGPTLALLGELDALKVYDHPLADPETGAAHACGHNAQVAGMIGAAMGIVGAEAARHLAGDLVFFAVPAEEMIEVDWRMGLQDEKKLEFLTGKAELIRLGHFDDVDMAMMFHTKVDAQSACHVTDTSNGALVKKMRFLGRASHAGGHPQGGINALNAANLALQAIALQRETFYDDDTVRIHPIITKGGDAVSVVPSEVKLETFIRGKRLEAILDANAKVDRALRGAAQAIGCEVEIRTAPGYLPQNNHPRLSELYGENARALLGADQFHVGGHRTGSTDMGDLGHIMPVVHPYLNGAEGTGHGKDYAMADPERVYVTAAKLLAMTAIDLLAEGGADARSVLEGYKPRFSRDGYLAFARDLNGTEHYADGAAQA